MANISNINNFFVVNTAQKRAAIGADLANNNGTPYVGVDFTVVGANSSSPVANLWLSNFTHKSYVLISDNSSNFIIRDPAASSNRLTIASGGNATFAGNVGIGLTPVTGWGASSEVIQLGDGVSDYGALAWNTISGADHFDLMYQSYFDGTNYKYGTGSAAVTAIRQRNGEIFFSRKDGGTANATFTWDDSLKIDSSGNSTFAGQITASKNQNATSSFTFQNTDTTGTSVRTHLNATAGNRSIRLEAIHSDYSYVVSNNARMYFQTNGGSNNTLFLDGNNATFAGRVVVDNLYSSTFVEAATLVYTSNGSAGAPSYTFSTDANTGIYRPSADTIAFSTGGSNALTLGNNDATFAGNTSANAVTARDNMFVDGGQFYIGADDGATVNTFRQAVVSGVFKIQMNEAGTWTDSLKIYDQGRIEPTGGVFLGSSNNSNLLNYYASGTWTPTVTTSQLTSPTITSSSGRWQRVGKVVTASFEFTMSNPTVGAGSVIINNLPIAFADNQHVSGCGVIGDLGKTINVRYYTGNNQIAMNFYDGNYCGTAFRTVGTVTYWAAT